MIQMLVALVLSNASLNATFTSSNTTGLTTPWTVFETDGSIYENELQDISPSVTLPDSVAKGDNSMAVAAAGPSVTKASFEDVNGNRAQAWEYPGTANYYQVADNNSLDYTDVPHYVVIMLRQDSGAGGADYVFTKGLINTSGLRV